MLRTGSRIPSPLAPCYFHTGASFISRLAKHKTKIGQSMGCQHRSLYEIPIDIRFITILGNKPFLWIVFFIFVKLAITKCSIKLTLILVHIIIIIIIKDTKSKICITDDDYKVWYWETGKDLLLFVDFPSPTKSWEFLFLFACFCQ